MPQIPTGQAWSDAVRAWVLMTWHRRPSACGLSAAGEFQSDIITPARFAGSLFAMAATTLG